MSGTLSKLPESLRDQCVYLDIIKPSYLIADAYEDNSFALHRCTTTGLQDHKNECTKLKVPLGRITKSKDGVSYDFRADCDVLGLNIERTISQRFEADEIVRKLKEQSQHLKEEQYAIETQHILHVIDDTNKKVEKEMLESQFEFQEDTKLLEKDLKNTLSEIIDLDVDVKTLDKDREDDLFIVLIAFAILIIGLLSSVFLILPIL